MKHQQTDFENLIAELRERILIHGPANPTGTEAIVLLMKLFKAWLLEDCYCKQIQWPRATKRNP